MKPVLGIIGGSGLYSLDGLKNTKLIIIKTTTPTIAIVLYCLFKYAFAPICIAEAISCILLLPALDFKIFEPVTNP